MWKNASKFLAPDVLREAAVRVREMADEAGVRLALLGGYALQFLGSDRLTADLDFVADAPVPGLRQGKRLTFGGYSTKVGTVPVDIILRDDDYAPLYEEALEHAVVVKDLPAPVVRQEYLLAMKMAAGREGKDEYDVEFLLGNNLVDLKKARRIVETHLGVYAAREMDQLVEIARWKHSRAR